MYIGKVIGTVVATIKIDHLNRHKLLLVTGRRKRDFSGRFLSDQDMHLCNFAPWIRGSSEGTGIRTGLDGAHAEGKGLCLTRRNVGIEQE